MYLHDILFYLHSFFLGQKYEIVYTENVKLKKKEKVLRFVISSLTSLTFLPVGHQYCYNMYAAIVLNITKNNERFSIQIVFKQNLKLQNLTPWKKKKKIITAIPVRLLYQQIFFLAIAPREQSVFCTTF